MFGKVFDTMYTGSMVGAGSTVFALMPYAVTHCNADGFVTINPTIIASVFGESVEQVSKAIDYLCAPDPQSRSPEEEGRRLVQEGPFLYRVVNHAKYRQLQSAADQREKTRERVRRHREKKREEEAKKECNAPVTKSNDNTETETETETIETASAVSCPEPEQKPPTRTPGVGFDYDSGRFSEITSDDRRKWTEAYPAVDIDVEIKRAALWLQNNPTKRKKNLRRFLTNWFSRTQERGGNRNNSPPPQSLRSQFDELWASKEHDQ